MMRIAVAAPIPSAIQYAREVHRRRVAASTSAAYPVIRPAKIP